MSDADRTVPRILVVEDDENLRELILKVVKRAGYNGVSANTGEQALSILRDPDHRVDWLLTDIRLPGAVDGWVVGSEFTLARPLQAVSYVSAVEVDAAAKRGRNSIFLQKPVHVIDLVATF